MVPPTPKRIVWRVTEAPWRMVQRPLRCSCAALSWYWGLVSSQYLISERWMSRWRMLRSLGRCCLGKADLLMARFLGHSASNNCLLLSPQEQKSNRLVAMKGGGFLGLAGCNWRRMGALQQHRQSPQADPPSPDNIVQKISVFSNGTFTPSRSSTVRTVDRRTSWAPHRNKTKASAPSSKALPSPFTLSFWEWVAISKTITHWSLLRSWVLILKELRNLLAYKLHVHSVNYAAELVHTRRAHSSTIINSHQQETVSGQACNPPDPHRYFSFSFGGGVLRYPVPKWLLFLNYCGGWFFTACVISFLVSFLWDV